MLKVSPRKGFIQFGKRGNLNPQYIGPFKILARIGPVAYRLELPEELSNVYSTFHVSNLKKCLSDESLIILIKDLRLDVKLNFVEEPIEIMDQEVKQLRQSRIPIVKVRCVITKILEGYRVSIVVIVTSTWVCDLINGVEIQDRFFARLSEGIGICFASVMSPSKRKFCWGIMRSTGIKRYIDPISGYKIWCTNHKCHIPIDLYPCKVEERMTMKKVGDQMIGVIRRRRIDKEGNVSRFQEYHTSDEEEEELSEHPPYNKYRFVDHPQLQMEDQRNKFAHYPLPPLEGNMNGWLTDDANNSDLESMASNQPMSLTMEDTSGS
ncbi:hypothetical protein Tco_0580190 [Tanacetum coccineum]